jgi:hypothetical protein
MKNVLLTLAAIVIVIIANQKVFSQPTVEVFATGFVNPIGIDIDSNGNLWVAEQGTGSGNTSKISVVTPNGQVYPFLIDLPSSIPAFEPTGAQDVFLDIDGKVLIAQSKNPGVDTLEERILVVDPAGWVPGNPPLNRSNIEAKIRIGATLSDSNPYKIEVGPNDDWFVIDAGGNCIFRRERSSGAISTFSTFSPVGQSDAVPTGLVYNGTNFYVSILTGLPIPIGAAKVYNVDLSGSKTIYQDGLTALVDVAINPVDNAVYAIQHGEMGPPWINSKGRLFRIQNGVVDTLLSEMPRPAGMVFNSNGDLFITTLQDDNVLKISNLPVGVEDENVFVADDFSLEQNYPNPFNPSTTIRYTISSVIASATKQSQMVTLKVYDVIGNEVSTLVNEEKSAGSYEVKFNASELSSGIYFYKLQAGSLIETKKMILLR